MEEKGRTWDENGVTSELTQGMELANELKKQLQTANSSREACGFLVEKIVSCYDNALALLNSIVESSPRSEFSDQDAKDHVCKNVHKKRRTLPGRSEQVHLCSGTEFGGQLGDGYNWRKYGQKDILGANHPRAYYRCTYRNTQGCLATKHVQQTDKDPSIVEVVYRGKHTCVQERLMQNKATVDDVKMKEEESPRLLQQTTISIEPGLEYEAGNTDTNFFPEPSNFVGTGYYSSPFLSPNTVDFTEIFSNPTSVVNFPLGDLDFSIDQMDFDSNFFNTSDYFL